MPGGEARYCGLAPLSIQAIWPLPAGQLSCVPGLALDSSSVAGIVASQLSLFATTVTWVDGTILHVLRREACSPSFSSAGGSRSASQVS